MAFDIFTILTHNLMFIVIIKIEHRIDWDVIMYNEAIEYINQNFGFCQKTVTLILFSYMS